MSDPTDAWMPFYVGDYLADTGRLTTLEHGAYLLIIMDYWVAGPPPDDDKQLAAIARLSVGMWRRVRPILAPFFRLEDGRWRHKRVEEEKEFAKTLTLTRKEAGRLGGEAARGKSGRPRNSKIIANVIANELQKNTPSPSPSPVKEETIVSSKNEAIVDDEMRAFAASLSPPVNPEDQFKRFKDWAESKGRRFRNEQAAFRNWLRKASDIAREHPDRKAQTPSLLNYAEPWPQRVDGWRNKGLWHVSWGPEPGKDGCRVPRELLKAEEAA